MYFCLHLHLSLTYTMLISGQYGWPWVWTKISITWFFGIMFDRWVECPVSPGRVLLSAPVTVTAGTHRPSDAPGPSTDKTWIMDSLSWPESWYSLLNGCASRELGIEVKLRTLLWDFSCTPASKIQITKSHRYSLDKLTPFHRLLYRNWQYNISISCNEPKPSSDAARDMTGRGNPPAGPDCWAPL